MYRSRELIMMSRKMYFLVCLIAVYPQLCCSKEDIIVKGQCKTLFRGDIAERNERTSAPSWDVTNDKDGACSICNSDNVLTSWFYTKFLQYKDVQLIHADIDFQITECKDCKNQYVDVYVIFEDLTMVTKDNVVKNKLRKLPLVKKLVPKKSDQRETHHIQFVTQLGATGVSLVFGSEGGCIVVYKLNVTSFYCEQTLEKAVVLPKTNSPGSGSIRVNSSCVSNTVSNGQEIFGLCSSNGTWEVKSPCLCAEGFGLGKDGCEGCRPGWYKDHIGNARCFPCPDNSVSSLKALKCECKLNYHRLKGENYTHSCYGIPSAVQDIDILQKTGTSMVISWDPPVNPTDLQVFFDVKCFKCIRQNCTTRCEKVTYSPAQFNITGFNVIIENFQLNAKYMFKISTKNVNNYKIDKSKWSFASKMVNTRGNICTTSSTREAMMVPLVVAMAVSSLFFIVALLGCGWLNKRNRPKQEHAVSFNVERENVERANQNENIVGEPPNITDISSVLSLFASVDFLDEHFWEFPRERLSIIKCLGGGNFGEVYIAKPKPIHATALGKNGIVAVKMLKGNASLKDERDFMTELNLMKKLETHRHVVQLLGCCTHSEPYLIILEYLAGGDLLGYLRKSRGYKDSFNTGELVPTSSLMEKDLLSFAWMVADGMAYLSSKQIVHRDLAARNVLVGEDNICKVSDFGLSREGSYERQTKARLPAKWMAPEDLLHGQCTTMSDVWSYGVLLWEIFTIGDSPYPGLKGVQVVRKLEQGYRMSKPPHYSDKIYSIMLDCWNNDPLKRPTFVQLTQIFHQMLMGTDQVYLDMTKYEDHNYINFDEF